jgi:hypothetical protein
MEADYLISIDLGTMNFAYCIINIKTEKIAYWDCVALCDNSNETHEKVCTSLALKLDDLSLTDISKYPNIGRKINMIIVLELQPKSNLKTIIMAGQVQMYFVQEKLKNLDTKCHINKIISYHARNKLRFYVQDIKDSPMKVDHLKVGYNKNKQTGKQHCSKIIRRENEDKKFIDLYNNTKKKDDLADCYLQGRSYIAHVIKKNELPLEPGQKRNQKAPKAPKKKKEKVPKVPKAPKKEKVPKIPKKIKKKEELREEIKIEV